MQEKLQKTLKSVFGYDSLRQGQQPIVESILKGKDALGIMPTGAGKSLCFQLPALCFDGITIVVSPLISLMKDQVMNLVQQGVKAAFLNSSLTMRQYFKATSNMKNGMYKIVYVAPERLMTERFWWAIEGLSISMVAVDEAHCVSQWGQDFRPTYLQIPEFIKRLKTRPVVAAFTATATPQVHGDIVRLLKLRDPKTVITGFDRPNLCFRVLKPNNKEFALMHLLQKFEGQSGIIYCSTRKQVEKVQEFLIENHISAQKYHAGMEDNQRHKAQEDFVFDRTKVMVATNAFGMGIDKSDIRFVIHYNMPMDLESYYQEIGRAGRDGESAESVLLYAYQDVKIATFLIEKSGENSEQSDHELEQKAKERLRRMTFYCNSKRCLRKELLCYFGEKSSPLCGNCSICLKEEQRKIAPPTRKNKAVAELYNEKDKVLFEVLKQKRAELAKRQGVPGFVIISDAVLKRLCVEKPKNRSELLMINGIGEEKARRYGEEILCTIEQWGQSDG